MVEIERMRRWVGKIPEHPRKRWRKKQRYGASGHPGPGGGLGFKHVFARHSLRH
jgi:hypothetical protein